MIKFKLFIVIAFSFTSVFAAQGKMLVLEGKIKSFDKETVKITTQKGVVSVPRKLIPIKVTLKTDDMIKLPLSEEQFSTIK